MYQDIGISFDGENRVIKADSVFDLVDRLEDKGFLLGEFIEYASYPKTRKFARITKAYIEVLIFAGFDVSYPKDRGKVHAELFNNSEDANNTTAVIEQIIIIMSPPSAVAEKINKASPGQKKMKQKPQTS